MCFEGQNEDVSSPFKVPLPLTKSAEKVTCLHKIIIEFYLDKGSMSKLSARCDCSESFVMHYPWDLWDQFYFKKFIAISDLYLNLVFYERKAQRLT